MRVLVVLLAAAVLPVALSGGALAHEGHTVRGVVGARVPLTNTTQVEIEWDFKCDEHRPEDASYEWELRLRRVVPKPERAIPLTSGTSRTGTFGMVLAPGLYEAYADPFRCQTFGAGSTAPQRGGLFVVPDYCAWTVQALRGAADVVGHGRDAPLDAGDVVRPGDALSVRGGGRIELGLGTSVLGLSHAARIMLERGDCATVGGWSVRLKKGLIDVVIAANAPSRARYVVASPNAVAESKQGIWSLEATGARQGWTRVRVDMGAVRVRGARGAAVVVRSGHETTVRGAQAPVVPRLVRKRRG